MNETFDTLQAKQLKEVFDVLFGPGPYELDYLTFEASGKRFEPIQGEDPAIQLLTFQRSFGKSKTLPLALNALDSLYSEWELVIVTVEGTFARQLPGEYPSRLLMWAVTAIAEAFAHDLHWLIGKKMDGEPGPHDDESVEVAFDRWWGITRILDDAAAGKLAEFDPEPQETIEQAQIGLKDQLGWLIRWQDSGLRQLLSSENSNELFNSLWRKMWLTINPPQTSETEKLPPSTTTALSENLSPTALRRQTYASSHQQRKSLSTNAMAWIVALAVGAFIAIGAALGY